MHSNSDWANAGTLYPGGARMNIAGCNGQADAKKDRQARLPDPPKADVRLPAPDRTPRLPGLGLAQRRHDRRDKAQPCVISGRHEGSRAFVPASQDPIEK